MKKFLFTSVIVLLYCSCGGYPDSYFKEKANGHRTFGLEGTYIFTYKISDSLTVRDTLRFERIRKNDFLITKLPGKDTIYLGEIVKRRGLYFMNKPSNQKGWWHISAFKFSGDSIYNYWGLECNSSYYEEIKEQKLFSDYIETENGIYINNSSSETYEAMKFSVMNGMRAGYEEIVVNDNGNKNSDEIEKKEQSYFLVYPNPVKDNLVIETKSDGNFRVEIIDMNGKVVRSEKFSESFLMMNVGNIPNGNYIVKATEMGNEQQSNFKIVVAK